MNKDKVITQLLKRISDLEFEIERLEADNEDFFRVMEIQNKREYRSKFLKDFQKEHGKNVFPDYDEIYKRYDDYKSRINKAIESVQEHYDNSYSTDDVNDIGSGTYDDLMEILKGVNK